MGMRARLTWAQLEALGPCDLTKARTLFNHVARRGVFAATSQDLVDKAAKYVGIDNAKWLMNVLPSGYGSGSGSGYGSGYGAGDGYGYGSGYGAYGYGSGAGYGYGAGDGDGYEYGDGDAFSKAGAEVLE